MRRGQLEAAEGHYTAAEALYRQIDDSLGLANTLQARGDLEKSKGHDDLALAFYRKASPIYQRIDALLGLTNVMAEVAELDMNAGRTDDTLAGIRTGLPIALQCENRYAVSKFAQILKRLGIDPDTLLSGSS
jgi:tetratricopeptide (TPR) repeat protein